MPPAAERSDRLPIIAVAIGDPAGIGPEIAVKAALSPQVRASCQPLLVGHESVVRHYRDLLAPGVPLRCADPAQPITADSAGLNVLAIETTRLDGWRPGLLSDACGRATLDYVAAALELARAGRVAAVAAGPHNQTAIRAAGIDFDGYPRFVAERTGTDPDRVFLMLADDERRIVHVTLHVGVRTALELIRRQRVLAAIRATDSALRDMGLRQPRIAVSGLNPHAGEGGLFGREEIEEIAPAIAEARDHGIDVSGPFGADTMLPDPHFDAYLVMLHDQGHIPAKLAGFASTSAIPIGVRVKFGSVAHGSAFEIAGRGIADPSCMGRTICRLAVRERIEPA